MAEETASEPLVFSGIEPKRAGVREVFPAGVATICCLVELPSDGAIAV